jgi:DNA-binding response OmpR family regulator
MNRILIIEEDKTVAAALTIRLESAGYQVLPATDGLAGVKAALADKPDLILSDIWMPASAGVSMATRLREAGLAGIPIIFITTGQQPGLRYTAWQLGAAGLFEKPYDPETLLDTIAHVLAKGLAGAPAR